MYYHFRKMFSSKYEILVENITQEGECNVTPFKRSSNRIQLHLNQRQVH